MQDNYIKPFIVIIILAFSLSLLTCSPSGGDATVNINLGFPHVAYKRSVIDSILNFFATRAYAQPPATVDQIVVRVDGPGMPTMEFFFTPDVITATVVVPSGSSRKFTVLADTPSATLGGSKKMNLAPGDNVSVTINMGLFSTKLVIPDNVNGRVVQIDDISGSDADINATWIDTNFGLANFEPQDIDFDSRGRIYIAANHGAASTTYQVIRVDDINGTPYTGFADPGSTIYAVTVDRKNSLVYYATSTDLYRSDYDGGSVVGPFNNLGVIFNIRGLVIDNNGIIYIAWSSGMECAVSAYDPGTETILDTYYGTSALYEYGWDVMVKPPYIYAAIDEGSLGQNRIIRFTFEGGTLIERGIYTTSLLGPHRFIAPLRSRIYFADDNFGSDRIVVMDNILGSNRRNYGQNGSSIGEFYFFDEAF